MEGAHRQRACHHHAPLVRSDDGESGGPCDADDRGTGQTAGRVQNGNRLRRLVYRMVRRGSQALVWRHHSGSSRRQAHHGFAPTGRRGRSHHALEFSERDDYTQGRTRSGRGLHAGLQARHANPLFGACLGGTCPPRRHPEGRIQHDHRQRRGDRRGNDQQPDGEETDIHRLDRSGQEAHGAMRGHGQETVARAGRQRAFYRIRRCRFGCRSPGSHGQQVSKYRPNLCLRQSALDSSGCLRRIRQAPEVRGRATARGRWASRASPTKGR